MPPSVSAISESAGSNLQAAFAVAYADVFTFQ